MTIFYYILFLLYCVCSSVVYSNVASWETPWEMPKERFVKGCAEKILEKDDTLCAKGSDYNNEENKSIQLSDEDNEYSSDDCDLSSEDCDLSLDICCDEEDTCDWLVDNSHSLLMRDLMIVEYWTNKVNERFPVSYNNFLYGGYINMPSARMGEEGVLGFGYSSVPPYRNFNGLCQLTPNIEISGNYRVFSGIEDPVLSKHGFGDFSDKGANIKLAIFRPEDSEYQLPGFAVGCDDFFGTRAFDAKYIVLTQVLMNWNLEFTLGYGFERIKRWFGGALWMPWRTSCNSFLKPFTFVVEYDATHYKCERHEHHPKGRDQKSAVNCGIKYRLLDCIDLSASYVRGRKFSFSVSTYYNFGHSKGFLPKINDPLPYRPIAEEDFATQYVPAGSLDEQAWTERLHIVFCNQGFDFLDCYSFDDACGNKTLRLTVHNNMYWSERIVRSRLNHILAFLTPDDFDRVVVVIEAEGFPVWQYEYYTQYLTNFAARQSNECELTILTPRREVTPLPDNARNLFRRSKPLCDFEVKPNVHTLFGSSRGKFKCALGITTGIYGFWKNIYYELYLGYLPYNSMHGCTGIDLLNPSQLINVHTDILLYYRRKFPTLDQAFLQRNWNMGKGFYSRIAAGIFDCVYGGVAGEILYARANSCWAVGIEGAALRKRSLHGFGFTSKIRKLHGYTPTWVKFRGSQYFLNLYYDWALAKLDFQVSIGKFLANDFGASYKITRYFPSGMRISFWYTGTNAHDIINGKVYHDVGVQVCMPLDLFLTRSSRSTFKYGMSAWVRDCGFRTPVGEDLYPMIDELRQN